MLSVPDRAGYAIAIPLLIDISVAILSTKIPVLLGHRLATFALPKLPHYGALSMVHEARTDFSMWLGLVFLLIVGGGWWSLDSIFNRRGGNAKAGLCSSRQNA